jgi:L-asparaginase II
VAAAALAAPPRPIHHNCSGKHALGLALCVVEGWPVEGYLEADHPLQRAMADAVAGALGVEAPPHAVDGCGMLTFHAPLAALARAFGRLAGGDWALRERASAAPCARTRRSSPTRARSTPSSWPRRR